MHTASERGDKGYTRERSDVVAPPRPRQKRDRQKHHGQDTWGANLILQVELGTFGEHTDSRAHTNNGGSMQTLMFGGRGGFVRFVIRRYPQRTLFSLSLSLIHTYIEVCIHLQHAYVFDLFLFCLRSLTATDSFSVRSDAGRQAAAHPKKQQSRPGLFAAVLY